MARVLRVIGLRTVAVAAILIVALLAAWPAAQRGAGESGSRLTATELRSTRLAERLRRSQETRQASAATLEIRIDELLDEVTSDGGTVLGKRYTNDAADLELLCTKPGDGSLGANGEALVLKEAKALPSSD